MLKALRDHAKRKSLDERNGFVAVLAVAHDARKHRHFGQPAAVILTFELDREVHRE